MRHGCIRMEMFAIEIPSGNWLRLVPLIYPIHDIAIVRQLIRISDQEYAMTVHHPSVTFTETSKHTLWLQSPSPLDMGVLYTANDAITFEGRYALSQRDYYPASSYTVQLQLRFQCLLKSCVLASHGEYGIQIVDISLNPKRFDFA